LAAFGARAGVEAFRPPYEPREIARHVYQFGARSTPLILTAGIAIGVVLSMHTRASLERFGAEALIPRGLAIALMRETGPLTVGLLVSGRVERRRTVSPGDERRDACRRDCHERTAGRRTSRIWSN